MQQDIRIERKRQEVFGVSMYYAICHVCRCWVKSSVGQFCWTQRHQRNAMADQHIQFHRDAERLLNA